MGGPHLPKVAGHISLSSSLSSSSSPPSFYDANPPLLLVPSLHLGILEAFPWIFMSDKVVLESLELASGGLKIHFGSHLLGFLNL